jgi:putative ABC transport system substrate-binding protein
MRRRHFGAVLGGVTASTGWPSNAQQKPMPLIGILDSTSPTPGEAPYEAAFIQGLADTGYLVGQNVAIERRYGEGHYDRLPALATDLVSRKVDVIRTGSLPGTNAAKGATSTIPIVFALGTDPIAAGVVSNLARPEGNLTGVSILNVELVPKRLDLLSELVPQAKTIALLVNPNNANAGRMIRDTREAARRKGVQVDVLSATDESEIDAAFTTLVQKQDGALVVGTDPVFSAKREQLIALAARHSVPTIFGFSTAGGLISYGTSLIAVTRQLGIYTGRILKGAKPGDLPVVQPTTFELVINLKTAKALGLTIPPSILSRRRGDRMTPVDDMGDSDHARRREARPSVMTASDCTW